MRAFTQFIQQLYSENQSQYPDGGQAAIRDLRQKAMDLFLQKELPDKRLQGWQQSVLNKKVKTDYIQKLQPDPYRPLAEYFQCRVQDLHPTVLPVSNGWFISENQTVNIDEQGVITGSLLAAIRQYPDLVLPLLAHPNLEKENGLVALNEALFNDGAFVYVPDNVKVEKPMQIVSLMNTSDPLLVNNRHLIVMGKNSELSVIQCDDSIQKESSFSNIVSEIYLGENAHLHYYKTENKDAASMLLNHVFVHQKSYSTFTSTAITFNAGYICNTFHVNLNEPMAETKLYGLYLVDKEQVCDNHIFINHAAPDCKSYQLYKGIMDDEASANFHGHILVAPDSQRTAAFQTNKNLLLTDKAHVTTKPFLEIYADDVQCSHGATVGQLDEEALYYLRTRGIGEAAANRLLMFAFANDIVQNVAIEALRDRLSNMVQHRLHGELNVCAQCMLNNNIVFPITLEE